MSWSGISFLILRREISFSCGWRLVPVLRHQISLPDPKWLHFLPLLSFACGKVIPAHPGLCGCIYVFLFSEPTFLFSERISKTSNQHILSGQLVREKSKKWLFPRAGNGLPQKKIKKNDKAVLYFAHNCPYIVFVFTILPNRWEKDIYTHLWKNCLPRK